MQSLPQYYVENSHPAIIEPDEWDHVQAELTRRKSLGRAYSGKSVFSAKLVCEECGSFFGSKVWHSTDQYRRRIWQDKKIALFIRTFKKLPDTMTDWDDTIWTVMVEKGIVHKDGEITFVFKDGTEIKVGA